MQLNANSTQKNETELYEEANKLFNQEKYKQAIRIFQEIEDLYPLSNWAMQAKLLSSISNYNMGDYNSAANSLEEYIYIYPNSDDLSYAYYLRILSYYMQISKIELGQQAARKTLELATEYINLFSKSEYINDIEKKAKLVQEHINKKDYSIAKFYFRRGEYLAAIKRFHNITDHENSSYFLNSLKYLAAAYSALGLNLEAEAHKKF